MKSEINNRKKFWSWLVIISQLSTSFAQATNTIIELDPFLPEKKLELYSAQKAERTEKGIEVITDESLWHPQLKSEAIPLDPHTGVELPFSIDLKKRGDLHWFLGFR